MPTTTTLAAGSSLSIAVAAGSALGLSGYGTAQLVAPVPQGLDGSLRQLVPTETRIGPFVAAVTVNVVALGPVSYYTVTPQDVLSANDQQALTAAQVATLLAGGGGGTPGGSTTQVQYNNAGAFAGAAGFTFDGTANVSLGVNATTAGTLTLFGGTSGKATLKTAAAAGTNVQLIVPAVDSTLATLGANTYTGSQIITGNYQHTTGVLGNSTSVGYYVPGQIQCSVAFALGAAVNTPDTYFTRSSAAALQLGAADAASPVAQTLRTQGPRGGTDSNVGGVTFKQYAGPSTGNATPNSWVVQSTVVAASGTTAQTLFDALTVQNGSVRRRTVTVANLPASPTQGDECNVSDAMAPVWNTALTGGGAVFCGARYNGAAWVAFQGENHAGQSHAYPDKSAGKRSDGCCRCVQRGNGSASSAGHSAYQ